MSAKKLSILSPVGRLVGGSLYEPRTTDSKGQPLIVKTGANAGQPRKEYSFGVAFPKTPGATHWAQEAWLQPVWALAHAAFPNGEAQRRDFSWKITDGDSQEPNKKMKKPCDQVGYPGHWVIWFSGGTAPKICNKDGSQYLTEPNAIKPGYFVQVLGNVDDNKPSESPGLYWNHQIVSLQGFGEEITFGPDAASAGFGAAALPPGASATPPAGMPGVPGVPAVPGAAPNVPGAPSVPATPSANVSPSVPVPGVPTSAVSVPARVMLPAANGATYEQLIANGWTDALLVQHGMMAPPAAATPAVPAPLAPVGSVPTPSVPASTVVASTPQIPVTPNAAFTAVPGMATPAVPAVPGATVAAPPARVMLPAANGATYEQLIAAGWNDTLLIQHGMMAA